MPRRLTWHPGADLVQGFAVDGKRVLFTSGRAAFTGAYQHLFTVPVEGGVEEQLPIPNAFQATYSPDGRRIAYNPLPPAYRPVEAVPRRPRVAAVALQHGGPRRREGAAAGGRAPTTWTRCGLATPSTSGRIATASSTSTPTTPTSKQVRRVTKHDDFPVMKASSGGGKIVYEQAGWLHLLDPASASTKRLVIPRAGGPARDPRHGSSRAPTYIRNVGISPSGARAVFEFRGEIVTVPAEKGDVRNLTASPGAHERSPEWSPDGSRVAYFSDASGEYELHVAPHDGKGDVKKYKLAGAGFYSDLRVVAGQPEDRVRGQLAVRRSGSTWPRAR